MRKHFRGLVFALFVCLALALPAFAANVAEFDGTGYPKLEDALLAALDDGSTIKLLDDAEIVGGYTYATLTIDLNGHKITGELTATGGLTLQGGTFEGTLNLTAPDASYTITAPTDADFAVKGYLEIASGCTISGAKTGVVGKLHIADGSDTITISGTESAVRLEEPVEGIATVYGAADASAATPAEIANYDTVDGTYKVGDEIAKVISNRTAGSPAVPSIPTLSTDRYTVHAGQTVTLPVTYTGTEDLAVYIQKNADDGTVTVANGNYQGGSWTVANDGSGTVAVTIFAADDSEGKTYPVQIYPVGSPARSVTVAVKVTPYAVKIETNGTAAYRDDLYDIVLDEDNTVITLCADIPADLTKSAVILCGKNMTLNLNGHSLPSLTVGNEHYDPSSGETTGYTDGEVTVTGDGSVGMLFLNYGKLTIAGGCVKKLTCCQDYDPDSDKIYGELLVTGGTVGGSTDGYLDMQTNGFTATISGGTGHSGEYCCYSESKMTVTGGEFGDVLFQDAGNGALKISGGTFARIRSNPYGADAADLAEVLADGGMYFAKPAGGSDYTQFTDATGVYELTDVKVVCCTHENIDANNICENCGQKVIAKVGDVRFTDFDAAANRAATTSGTVTLLSDVTINRPWALYYLPDGTYTLDLAGHWLSVTSGAASEDLGRISSGDDLNLTVRGSGKLNVDLYVYGRISIVENLSVDGAVNVFGKLTVDNEGYSAPTFNGEITVKTVIDSATGAVTGGGNLTLRNARIGQNVTVENKGELYVEERTGVFGVLFTSGREVNVYEGGRLFVKSGSLNKVILDKGAYASVSGGSFDSIRIGTPKMLRDILHIDYAFYDLSGNTLRAANVQQLSDVRVLLHEKHTDIDLDEGICACGREIKGVRMAPDAAGNLQTVEGYPALQSALAAAQDGETVRVLGVSPYISTELSRTSKINLTLDLYGNWIQGILTVKNVNLDVINTKAVTRRSYIRGEVTVGANSVLRLCNVSVERKATVYGRLETYAENTGDFVEFTKDLTFETGSAGALAAGTKLSTLAMRSGTVGDVLPDGCGYVETGDTGTWIPTDYTVIADATVSPAPIYSVSIVSVTGVYGKETTLTAAVVESPDAAFAGLSTTYQWYTVMNGIKTAIDGATGATYTIPANTRPASYTYALTATRGGFEKTATVTVQIDRATLIEGVHYTAPTAKTLEYNGTAQELVTPGSIAEGDASLAELKFFYARSFTESFSEEIPTGTEPGNYTVWYDIYDRNNCYKQADAVQLNVRIEPATVTIANLDYPTSVEYGNTVPMPTAANFTVTGNYKNVWMTHEWQKENGGYLTNAPTEVGKYILHLYIAETDCTKAATLALPFEIVPNTELKTVGGILYFNNRKSSQQGNAAISSIFNRAGLNPSGGALTLNSAVTLEMAEGDTFVPYDAETASFGLSARTVGGNVNGLLITVYNISFADDETFARVRLNVGSENYANVEVTLTLKAASKEEKSLDIAMDDWVYGQYDASVNKPRYTTDTTAVLRETVAFRASDGTPLTEVPTDVGSYKVYVECETEDYIYSGITSFSITRRDITNDAVVELENQLTYTGQSQEQRVKSVKLDGNLIPYTIVGNTPRATDAGEYILKIEPSDNNYTGTVEVPFTVLPRSIGEAAVTIGDALVYTGDELTQTVASVKYNGMDVTYTVKDASDKATAAGDYAITLVGTGNYTGEVNVPFTVAKRDIAEATVTLGETLTYTGKTQTQTVASVKYNGKDVTYTVKNDSDKATNAGDYTLTLVGTGSFTGEVNVPFTVAKRDIVEATVTLGDALTYNTVEQTQTVASVKYGDVDAEYTVKSGTDKATNAGDYALILVGGGNFTGEAEVPFTVSPKTVTATVAVTGNYVYSGSAILPTVKAYDGSVEIDQNEYTVECENNLNAGTATVYLRNAAGGNYVVSGETTFEIDQADQVLAAAAVSLTYGESGKSVSATGTVGALTYTVTSGAEVVDVDASGMLTAKQGGDAIVCIRADGDANHKAATVDVAVHVEKAHVTLRALDKSIRSGRTVPSLKNPVLGTDYTVTGLIGDDTLAGTVTLSYAVTPNKDKSGDYEILISHDGTDARYTADAVSGKLTVVKSTGTDNTREETSYKISLRYGAGGSVEPYGTVMVKENEDMTLRFVPDEGYKVASVIVDGSRVGAPESYTFRRVREEHTLEVTFAKIGETVSPVFDDVDEDSYYADAVDWAVGAGITVGASESKFAPDAACTRAQAVTFLWRAVGSPAAKGKTTPFTDVKADAYYAEAVIWATEKGIVKGVSETKFNPDGICTRAEIVTLLWRLMESPAAGKTNPFADVKADAYYAEAVLWAVDREITVGTGKTAFSPSRICTRAEIVTFLYRTLVK